MNRVGLVQFEHGAVTVLLLLALRGPARLLVFEAPKLNARASLRDEERAHIAAAQAGGAPSDRVNGCLARV
jgi:hypothetical protein